MVDPMGPTVVAAADMVIVEVLAMVKLVMKDVQEEHLNSTVGLDEEMNSNGKGLDEGTGVHRMMTLQSKQLVIEEVVNETEKILADEKRIGEEDAAEGNKDSPANENEEKESEDKEMTLEEYEKVLEEKRKAL
ncbi:hypothetical protein JHK82_025024 [Glycine max]|nr:hypothetical protein JHK87_024966 [Glycine soja]KAG5007098.1 hypothetical protein JHK85_025640 [Glycine max]KAG5012884.1 hypothetical protein JHK86_025145 [Glycine max]KAG5133836.1 hypothetical protein JHK82_025024 [Glycine max]